MRSMTALRSQQNSFCIFDMYSDFKCHHYEEHKLWGHNICKNFVQSALIGLIGPLNSHGPSMTNTVTK